MMVTKERTSIWAVLTLVTCCGVTLTSARTNSSVSCTDSNDSPHYRRHDTRDVLKTHFRYCQVFTPHSNTGHQDQVLAVPVSLEYDIFYSDSRNEEYLMMIYINCTELVRIYFTDYKETKNLSLRIGHFMTHKCDIFWKDIDIIGRVIDLRYIELTGKPDSFEHELALGYFNRRNSKQATLNSLPRGLVNVGSLSLFSTRRGTAIDVILSDYVWPLLAVVEIRNYDLSFDTRVLSISMPNLQSIQLNDCDMTEPFTHFPWHSEQLELPRKLERLITHISDIPNNIYIRNAEYSNNVMANLKNVTLTGQLCRLNLSSNQIDTIGSNMFTNTKMIITLDLSRNNIRFIPPKVFNSLQDLQFLYIEHNLIQVLAPGLFFNNPRLMYLNMSHNNIKSIADYSFQELVNLYNVDLSHNNVSSAGEYLFNDKHISNIGIIRLSSNNMTLLPSWVFLLPYAHTIDISDNPVTWESFRQTLGAIDNMTFLERHIDLSTQRFVKPYGRQIQLSMRGWTDFTTVRIDKMSHSERHMFTLILGCFELDFNGSSLNCDCDMYQFYLFVRSLAASNFPYMKTNFKCYQPKELLSRPLVSLDPRDIRCAQNYTDCPQQCTCLYQPSENQLIVDCRNSSLTSLPLKVPDQTDELIASGNFIKELQCDNRIYLSNIRVLDVSGNIISNIDKEFLTAVASINVLKLNNNRIGSLPKEVSMFQNASLTLGGNPWKCDCTTDWMKDWIVVHRKYIDIEEMRCATGEGRGRGFLDVPSDMFVCLPSTAALKISLITVSVVAVVFVTTILVMYKYRGEIKVLLYVHFNWHPFDRAQEADILDKEYDVFISYSSLDFSVAKTIFDFLESQNPPFKVCLHDKDFIVGAPIQENIMDSVRTSRRMIMLLTNNYLESDWCAFEFRAAHDRVLNDHTKYLILVLADDIPQNKLEDDMKLYIRTNTYLSMGNRWFYDKLRYVLPPVPLSELESNSSDAASRDSRDYYDDDIETPLAALI